MITSQKYVINLSPADVFVNMPIKPPIWLWEGQMALGCVTLLVGPPKVGKSLFVRNLLRCISKGENFLNLGTTRSAVAYLALEEHPSFLQKSFKDAKMDHKSIHVHYGPVVGQNSEAALQNLAEYCMLYEIKFVVIDPMTKFCNIKDTNDYTKVYQELSEIIHFARNNDIHVLIVHHSNKSGGDSTNQILGSTGIFGVSDGAFLLSKNKKTGSLRSSLRYGDPLEDCHFHYDELGILLFDGTKDVQFEKSINAKVIEYLSAVGEATFKNIIHDLAIQRTGLVNVLSELETNGEIIRSGKGTKGSEYSYSIPGLESQGAVQNMGEIINEQ